MKQDTNKVTIFRMSSPNPSPSTSETINRDELAELVLSVLAPCDRFKLGHSDKKTSEKLTIIKFPKNTSSQKTY